MWEVLVKSCELVEVRSKKTECVDLRCNVSMHKVQRRKVGSKIMVLTQRLPKQAQIRRK